MDRQELLAQFAEPIPVLDHGFVRLIDVMGDDESIESAARLSYQKGTRKVSETRGLLRYLMRHKHTSPFEQAVITLDMKLPIFVARQYVRHRTQALNEVSGRYSELPAEYYIPAAEQVCYQSQANKQGRSGPLHADLANHVRDLTRDLARDEFHHYQRMLEWGVARETARMNLPLSTYTHWRTTMSLHNLLHMLSLRLNEHAQWEARQYAEAIAKIVQAWVPLTWEAFVDYRLNAHTFSGPEMDTLREVFEAVSKDEEARKFLASIYLRGNSQRERAAFQMALGLDPEDT